MQFWSSTLVRFLTAFIIAFAATSVSAQFVFEKTRIEKDLGLKARTMKAEYPFTNKGSHTIKIVKVRTSCGCTAAALAKKIYKSGESGKIVVTHKAPSTPGKLEKYIYVMTNDKKKPSYRLVVAGVVPEVVKIKPRFIMWKHAEAPKPKKITAEIVYKKQPVTITKVTTTNKSWICKLVTVEAGKKYEIEVTPPKDTKLVSRTNFDIHTDVPKKESLGFRVSARIARKREKPKTNWLNELLR
jgi:hypothetical protein